MARLSWAIIGLPFQGGRWSLLTAAGMRLSCEIWPNQAHPPYEKIREHLLIGVLVATTASAAWMTFSLRTELTGLKASHHQLEEKHRRMKKSYIQFIANSGTGNEAFRRVVAALEEDGGADLTIPSGPSTTRANAAPGIRIK